MDTPNDPGPRRVRPGDDLAAVFGTQTGDDDEPETHVWSAPPAASARQTAPSAGPAPTAAPAFAPAPGPAQAPAPAPVPPHMNAAPAAPAQAFTAPGAPGAAFATPGTAQTVSSPFGTPAPANATPTPRPITPFAADASVAPPVGRPVADPTTASSPGVAAHYGQPGAAHPARDVHPPAPSALEALGLSRCVAWSVVLGLASIVVAFYPAAPLNIVAAGLLALLGLAVAVVGLVRGPRTGRLWLVAVLGVALCAVGAGISFPLVGPLTLYFTGISA